MVVEKEECSGSENYKGYLQSVKECASTCEGIASMFAFGTNDFGVSRCTEEGCKCLCETGATESGICDRQSHYGFRLYQYSVPPLGYYHLFHKNMFPIQLWSNFKGHTLSPPILMHTDSEVGFWRNRPAKYP